jgi:hypothetical protein
VGDRVEDRRDLRGQRRAGVEAVTLDAEDDDVPREPAERPGELDRLGDPDRVRGRGASQPGRERPGGGVDPMDHARSVSRSHGVDDHHRVRSLPDVEQADALALELPYRDGAFAAQAPGQLEPGGIVAAQRVAHADHQNVVSHDRP